MTIDNALAQKPGDGFDAEAFLKGSTLGWIGSGGCGINDMERLMRMVSPKQFPGFELFVTDTNERVLAQKFSHKKPHIKRWLDAGRLTRHVLGRSVAHGNGAGADPDIGMRAAQSKESREAFTAFMKRVKHVGFSVGVGGGTGSGSGPVIAEYAEKVLKDRSVAVITFPREKEGREDRAKLALSKIKKHVSTVTVYNDHLAAYLANLPEEERDKISVRDTNTVISEFSSLVIVSIFYEVFQVPGDEKDLDPADMRKIFSMGRDTFATIATIPKAEQETFTVESVGKQMVNDNFQRTSILKRAVIVGMRFHGKLWSSTKVEGVQEYARHHITGNKKAVANRPLEIIVGMAQEVPDDKMFVILLATAPVVPNEEEIEALPVPVQETVAAETEPQASVVPAKSLVRMFYSYNDGKSNFDGYVPKSLAEEWRRLKEDPDATEKEFRELADQLERATAIRDVDGKKPDLPERFRLIVPQPPPITGGRNTIFSKTH